jgi:hypothetical protein
MTIWCLAQAAFGAELWWVPDEDTAGSLRSALVADWSDRSWEVVVGGKPDEAYGWTWNGDTLEVRTAETRRLADADDAHVAVLFARTWDLRTETPGWERWLPAGEEELLAESAPFPPTEAVRAPPDPDQTPWSLGLGLGTRTMTQVPSFVPSVRVPGELVVGSWILGADFAADPTPRSLVGAEGLVDGVKDLWSATVRSGIRSRGPVWMSLTPGLQFRSAAPTLARDGQAVAFYNRPAMAGVLDLGIGKDAGVLRLGLHTWVRTSYALPLSAGFDLELLVFAHERRR